MNKGKTIFAQLMSLFTEYEFSKCVSRYKGDRHAIKFNCRDQFLVMSFAQFTDRSGLRDIETTLDPCSQDLYRSVLKVMPKSTLAEANKKRDWRIYQDFGYVLIKKAKDLYADEKLRIDLDEYDFMHSTGVSERQLRELRQLAWLNQAYNLILTGPSGTGKTYIASGLIYDALKSSKKAYMISMEDILTCLRTKDISMSALTTYNKWLKADLLAIDDIMLFPVNKEESASFFNLINSLHEKTSVVITTNKAPTEWAQTLNDEVLATAIIDRLLYRCEVIKLAGTSYRLENRKTIFTSESTVNGKQYSKAASKTIQTQ